MTLFRNHNRRQREIPKTAKLRQKRALTGSIVRNRGMWRFGAKLHYCDLERHGLPKSDCGQKRPFCYTLLFSRVPTSGMFALSEVAMNVSMSINGKSFSHEVEPRLLLIHYLREVVGLTGSHVGCETSLCGACTIELNGRAVKSCSIFAVQADGARITTIEGLASDGQLHGVQQAFWNEHALQCGFCTPGMIITSKQIIERNPNPTEEEIREGLSGNICRCTGYQHIV